ncbi:hypothetical protein LCGC14_1004410 [marine sediment metagenome]|uniref:Uncharacterized protein n=1 Tax=marine sediment metagenome TaxID=412755 RepID=A0A0F9R869_9ZZZZ
MFQSKTLESSYNRERERSTDLPDGLINHMTMCYLRSGCQLILDTVDETKLIAESVNGQYWDSNDLVFYETIVSKKRKVTL